ncbi:MAG: SDR family oxidoreductase [Bacteroidota bacterium]
MNQSVIVTGSNGLLGQKLVNLLAERPSLKLYATGRGVNRHPLRTGYEYKNLDLLDFDGWKAFFEKVKPTAIIHGAAATQVDKCELDHEMCDQVNIEATRNLVKLCQEHGTRMLYVSTDFVFDGENGPYKEGAATGPVNYYGESKVKAEQLVAESGLQSCILRTILLYGMTPGMSRSNIVLWVKKSLEEGKNIRVVNDQFRTPTLAEDLASACVSALMREATGLFHISGPEMMGIHEVAYAVADFWKLDKSLISETDSPSLGQPARRPPKTGFIILKAQTELDYKPHTLKEGLAVLDRQLQETAVS